MAIQALRVDVLARPASTTAGLRAGHQGFGSFACKFVPVLALGQLDELAGDEGTDGGASLRRHDTCSADHLGIELEGQIRLGHHLCSTA
jgi:hypothetical protein